MGKTNNVTTLEKLSQVGVDTPTAVGSDGHVTGEQRPLHHPPHCRGFPTQRTPLLLASDQGTAHSPPPSSGSLPTLSSRASCAPRAMKESAVSLVDVPAASTTESNAPVVCFDLSQQQLEVEFPACSHGELDDTFDEIADLLGIDASEALRVHLAGPGATAAAVQAVLRFISRDCDRPIQAVALDARARHSLLRESVGRAFEPASESSVRFSPPPVRTVSAVPVAPEAEQVALAFSPPGGASAGPVDVPAATPASEDVEPIDSEALPEPEVTGSTAPPSGAAAAETVSESSSADPLANETADSAPPTTLHTVPSEGQSAGGAASDPEDNVEAEAGADVTSAPSAADNIAFETTEPSATPVSEVSSGGVTESLTEQIVVESFIDDAEATHSRPWGTTDDGDRRVLALRRTIRSGKIVRFAGDVVVFGDINPGGQVIADGDIVVLGRLRGLAHAGRRGDGEAIVVGLDMQSGGQVRIGDIIAFPQASESPVATTRIGALLRRPSSLPTRSVSPSVARVVDGQIRIEDYHGRLHA
ncbi:MAG: hypothetical protein CL927_19290 [Deltaproteobacteria bacterium]|mgnify:CR=1 FL=1|nr:hypothetical protein [Deltaproteobacteria bacterium]HCH65767.1 hypothetical protein [Deltaproteobacteria bacterium]